jgi:hypothetical protein
VSASTALAAAAATVGTAAGKKASRVVDATKLVAAFKHTKESNAAKGKGRGQ